MGNKCPKIKKKYSARDHSERTENSRHLTKQFFTNIFFGTSNLSRWRVVSVETIRQKIDFLGNCIAKSNAYFFVNILNFIFTPIIYIKFFEKWLLAWKKWFFRRFIFNFWDIKVKRYENNCFQANLIQNKEKRNSIDSRESKICFSNVILTKKFLIKLIQCHSRSEIEKRVTTWQIKT